MSNQEIIEKFYYEIWNQGLKEVAYEILSPKLVFRGSTGSQKNGIEEFLSYVDLIRGALSDYECIIEEIVTETESSFAKMTFMGIHSNTFFEVPPTNRKITWSGVARFQIQDSKIVDLWVLGDVDCLKEQLGISSKIDP